MERRMRLQEPGDQEKWRVLVLTQKTRRLKGHKCVDVILRLQVRSDLVVDLHLPRPRTLAAPQMGPLRKSAAVIEHRLEEIRPLLVRGDIVSVKWRLRAEVHQPVVESEVKLEAMQMRLT